jgi:hypothetical protein
MMHVSTACAVKGWRGRSGEVFFCFFCFFVFFNKSGNDLKLYVPFANNFFSVLKKTKKNKTELDYDTGIFMRLWNVKNIVSAVLSTIMQL